jgi:hypothetical protein
MPTNNSTRRTHRGRRSRKSSRGLVSSMIRADTVSNPQPPMYNSSHRYFKRIRFEITDDLVNYPIRSPDVANLLLTCNDVLTGTGTVTASAVWSRFRCVAMQLWVTGNNDLPQDISLSLVDPNNLAAVSSEQTVSGVSTSNAKYATVKLIPKSDSIASQWQNAATAGWGVKITAPPNALFDITLEVYINNADPVQSVTVYCGPPGGAFINPSIVAGAIFMNYLDPSPTGANPGVIIPIDYQTNASSSVATARPL